MSTAPNTDVTLRAGLPTDKPFIRSTWLHSYEKSADYFRFGDAYFSLWSQLIDLLLRRSVITVAVDPSDPDVIVGYLVAEPSRHLLHYTYVRGRTSSSPGLQRAGVATALVQHMLKTTETSLAGWKCTHETKLSRASLAEHPVLAPLVSAEVFP